MTFERKSRSRFEFFARFRLTIKRRKGFMKISRFRFAAPLLFLAVFLTACAGSGGNSPNDEAKNSATISQSRPANASTAPAMNTNAAVTNVNLVSAANRATVPPLNNAPATATANGETIEETIPEVELQSLVKSTLLDFNSAVQSESFESFHNSASSQFQRQYTPEYLMQAFGKFVEKQTDFSKIAALQADLNSSFEIENGKKILAVSGSYPTKPATLFDIKYVEEDLEWKVVYINVGIK